MNQHTHPLKSGYLVLGLILLAVAAIWTLRVNDVIDADQIGWIAPAALIGAGVIALAAFAFSSTRRDNDTVIEERS